MPDAEASLYALLGRFFAAEIDRDLFETLQVPDIRETFEKIEPGCTACFDEEAAAAEFCRLFVLPKGTPAVAGAWLKGTGSPNSTAIVGLVLNLRSALDLDLPDHLPPDHAGVLLPLMAWLLDHQPDAAADFREQALAPWVAPFAAALQEKAELPLYRVVAKILPALIPPVGTS